MNIVQHPFACERDVPVRKHKKRKNQSNAYHARIQKKWRKRFGTKKENLAIFIGSGLGLGYGDNLFVDIKTRNFT